MKIWLDDIGPAPEGWEWAKSIEEFENLISYLEDGPIEEVSFDHDLGEYIPSGGVPSPISTIEGVIILSSETHTGYTAAKSLIYWFWLADDYGYVNEFPKWSVHSANPVGAENIRKLLENYEKHINQ